MNGRALVILSGGQDSTTCLYWALSLFDEVHAITFDYGQRHRREIMAAREVGALAGVSTHRLVKLDNVLESTSPLLSGEKLEQYADHRSLPGGLEKTFVPMRNQLFLTVAANRAYALGTTTIVIGVSSEDYGGYPDCRQEFIDAFVRASTLGTFTNTGLHVATPLITLTKKETVELATSFPRCWEALALTHTSYAGEYPPSSKDHASLLRAKGFEEAGLPDPLMLRAYYEGLAVLPDTPNYTPNDNTHIYFERIMKFVHRRGKLLREVPHA